MSLITRCPTCATLFKVVPDQLRISNGWVRCGQCEEIFDASLHLSPLVPEPILSAPVIDVASVEIDTTEADPVVELSTVSFLRQESPNSLASKRRAQTSLLLLSLVLLLALTGQIVFHERDRILAFAPGAKPGLLEMCNLLNCTLSPLRRIEFVVIDSSSFSKIRGDSYRLNLNLKNTASGALALPAIELTLTDTLDQPVMRRVFLPAELGDQLGPLAAGAEWPVSLALAVTAAGMIERVAGYRVLAFYP